MSDDSFQRANPWASGVVIFAAANLFIVGLLQFLQGIAAVVNNNVFILTADYLYEFTLTTWGWIHIVLGVVALVVGACVLAGQKWAMVAGLVIAFLLIGVNFMWVPYQPVWAVLLIAFSLVAIWALTDVLTSDK